MEIVGIIITSVLGLINMICFGTLIVSGFRSKKGWTQFSAAYVSLWFIIGIIMLIARI